MSAGQLGRDYRPRLKLGKRRSHLPGVDELLVESDDEYEITVAVVYGRTGEDIMRAALEAYNESMDERERSHPRIPD